jgi:hypothetical protein
VTKPLRYVIPKSLERFLAPDDSGYPALLNSTQAAEYLGLTSGTRGFAVLAAQYRDDWPPVVLESDGGRCKFYLRAHFDLRRERHPPRPVRPDDNPPT